MLDGSANSDGTAPVPDQGSQRADPPHGLTRENVLGFLLAVRQRRKTLIAVIVLIPLCAFLVLRQMTPLYTATGSLIYDPSEYKVRELQSIL